MLPSLLLPVSWRANTVTMRGPACVAGGTSGAATVGSAEMARLHTATGEALAISATFAEGSSDSSSRIATGFDALHPIEPSTLPPLLSI